MKKIILCAIVALTTTVYAQGVASPQYIITDCGTVHACPGQMTPEDVIYWLDFWTEVDCN